VQPRRIYLDNAATSWPKPESVYRAVDSYLRELGAPAGRSAYADGLATDALVEQARRSVARLLSAPEPNRVIFTSGGTEGLNLAIRGLLRAGDRAITTVAEHNSVLRPLRALEDAGIISVTQIGCSSTGFVDLDKLKTALKRSTRLVAITHASNVTGAIQPIREVARLAHDAGAIVLVDAAQSAGHIPIDVVADEIDLLAAPGHKGLLGPLGTGALFIRPGLESEIESLKQGGTGTSSDRDRQPDAMPHKFESGSPNVPGIIGLGEGVRYILDQSVAELRQHSNELGNALMTQLGDVPSVQLYGPADTLARVGLASVVVQGYDPQEVAATLDAAKRIQVRAGFHCAAAMHASLGTASLGGTVRLSWGPYNTVDDIAIAVAALRELAAANL
jgi:cysteine desulfurase / selenocysteine lyase